jgi:FkbM family methyltransferase
MKYLINSLRKTKIAGLIRRNLLMKSAVKAVYKFIMFPFTRRGVDVDIGGAGPCKLDYNFALRGYEDFGDRHNIGFRKWVEYCKDKTVIFDIGAHIGLYTIPASKVIAPDGIVYAFEPSEANGRYLRRHLEYNNIHNVMLLPYIIGEETKERQIFYENKYTDPMNSIFPKKNINRYSKIYREQMSLNDFVSKYDVKPRVIKIDVEGAEYNVLKGACEIIRKYKPIIFLSTHPKQLGLFGTSVDELKDIINNLSYAIQDLNGKKAEAFEHKEYILTPAEGRFDG